MFRPKESEATHPLLLFLKPSGTDEINQDIFQFRKDIIALFSAAINC